VVQGFTNGRNEDESWTCVFEVHGKPSQGQVFGLMPFYRFAQLGIYEKTALSRDRGHAAGVCRRTNLCAEDVEELEGAGACGGAGAEILDAWNGIGDKLIEMAQDFTEEKYDFRPTPDVRTFAEVLIHLVGTTYIFTEAAQGKPLRTHD
jgi:hypothetical protein